MIAISTQIFDLDGHDIIDDSNISNLIDTFSRRVTSSATLDGGSFVTDSGYSSSDKTLTFDVENISASRIVNFIRIAKYHSNLWVSMASGCYVCIIKDIRYSQGVLSFNMVVVEEG